MNVPKLLVQQEPRGPSQLIEIPVTAAFNGLTRVPIPDIPLLRNAGARIILIKGMCLITPSVLPVAPTAGQVNAPLTELRKASLTLYSHQWEKGMLIPLLSMNNIYTEGSGEPWVSQPFKLDDWADVDWNKSYITYANGTPVAGAPYTILFDVLYQKVNTDGTPVKGPGF